MGYVRQGREKCRIGSVRERGYKKKVTESRALDGG